MPPQEIPRPQSSLPPVKLGKLKASSMIVRESWSILIQDKEILWFPILSAIVNVLVLSIFCAVFYFVILGGDSANLDKNTSNDLTSYAFSFVYYIVIFLVANFFQAAILTIAHGRFSGLNLTFSDGLRGASRNFGKIFLWSLISATVGMVLKVIADKSKIIGKLVSMVLGATWNILTYFSLTSLVIGETSVIGSFKESAALIRKTWGEAAIVNIGVGLFFGLISLGAITAGIIISVLVPKIFVILPLVVIVFIFLVLVSIISSTLSTIFKLALYEYARSGTVPQGFSPVLIQNAVKVK
jgi:hypothetical protein